MNTASSAQTKVIVVGGGFAGIRAATKLARHDGFQVTLVSASDNFSFYPQLYHAATGGARAESSLPLADVLSGTRVTLARDTITKFDPEARTVSSDSGTSYAYDYLLLALGSVTNYFGIQGLKEFSYDIKTIEGAERFKQHLHDDLLDDNTPDPNYVIVGGGPTGVELAAALDAYLERITRLHGIAKPKYNLDLVEGSPRILPRSPEAMSAKVQKHLESLGVNVMTGAVVQAETVDALQLKGESIASRTVVWTAGVSNNPFFKDHAEYFTLAKNGKVEVNEYLEGRPGVFVLGDNAATQYSGLAQTAVSDADFAAAHLLRLKHNEPPKPYRPKAPISVIPVGEYWAAVQWGNVQLYGFIGFLLRRAADLIAYVDIQGIPKALKVWLQDTRREDNCPVCSGRTNS